MLLTNATHNVTLRSYQDAYIIHFPPNCQDVYTALCIVTRAKNENIKYFIPPVTVFVLDMM